MISHDAHCLLSTVRTAKELYNITWDHVGKCPDFAYTHHADEDAARQGWTYLRVMQLMNQSRGGGSEANAGPPLKRNRTWVEGSEKTVTEDGK